jgi:hypothetical protein
MLIIFRSLLNNLRVPNSSQRHVTSDGVASMQVESGFGAASEVPQFLRGFEWVEALSGVP